MFFVGMPALVMGQSSLAGGSPLLGVVEYVLLGTTALITIWGALWARGRNLSFGPAVRVLFGATMPTSAWREPGIARLLLPARGVRPPNDRDPADYVRAIGELAAIIRGPAQDAANAAAVMSGRLSTLIASRDAEIALIELHASHSDLERLSIRCAQLEEGVTRGNAGLQRLLNATQGELAELREMRRKRDALLYERGKMFELIRGVWTHLCRLHEQSSGATVGSPDPAAALAALSLRIERLLTEPPDQLQRSA